MRIKFGKFPLHYSVHTVMSFRLISRKERNVSFSCCFWVLNWILWMSEKRMVRRIFCHKMDAVKGTWKNFHTEKKMIIFYSIRNMILPVQTGPGAHPVSCKMSTGSFPGVKCGRGVLLTTHPLLVPRSWKSRAIPLPTLWATPGL